MDGGNQIGHSKRDGSGRSGLADVGFDDSVVPEVLERWNMQVHTIPQTWVVGATGSIVERIEHVDRSHGGRPGCQNQRAL